MSAVIFGFASGFILSIAGVNIVKQPVKFVALSFVLVAMYVVKGGIG